ncbi:Transcription factor E2F6 [Merluccius polli]|uniref:Transcription factor E2F6 n=1 Tax=Merluccius polli TaxID=89951 RepID=A0AA47MI61_MERPO|nr:Transcription factor E2F6 [Merluccius polli]
MNKCVVSGCPSRRKGPLNRVQKRFFHFPKDQARVKVWLAALRETEKQDSQEQHMLCEDHFLPQHITAAGIREDAIPIMPPYLDGVLGDAASPWAEEEESEEDQQWADDGEDGGDGGEEEVVEEEEEEVEDEEEEEDDDDDAPLPPQVEQQLESAVHSWPASDGKFVPREVYSRNDVSLAWLTKAVLQEMVKAPDGVLDLRQAVVNLKTRRRRVYDITNVMSSISLIKKESANKVKWIGKTPVSCFLQKSQHSFQKELSNLKTVEDSLDEVIKTCAKQLFDLTDNPDNIKYPFHIGRIEVFQHQTVMVVKAPEDTKLEVPTPKEDSIQMKLKAVKGPIAVLTSEMGLRPGTSTTTEGCFIAVERSRIRTAPLNTGSSHNHGAPLPLVMSLQGIDQSTECCQKFIANCPPTHRQTTTTTSFSRFTLWPR